MCVCVFNFMGHILRVYFVLICSCLHMSNLTFEWNEFMKAPYVSQILSASIEAMFGGVNNEIINTMMNHLHLYKK